MRLAQTPSEERVVGQLAQSGQRLYFEYDAGFLEDPLWLSPFKLPPQPGLVEHRDRDFGPVFGLFDDSLPDGWGLLLMDRFFRQQGVALGEVSVLDRLAYLGSRTMGALTYHPPSDPQMGDARALNLHEMARASEEVLIGRSQEVLPQLLRAGGSPGGARPKVLVGVSGEQILSGEGTLPAGFASWIVKFRSREDLRDAGAVELAYAAMAREAGINMPATRLFKTSAGERFFGVERFDRSPDRLGQARWHVHTFGNLIHADFRIPSCDYQQLLEVTRTLTRNRQDVLECYRRMVFNVLTHNRDDHAKNFAFRMTHEGNWELAPAYDLMFAVGPGGEHSTTVAGEGRVPGRRHLQRLAELAQLESAQAERIVQEVASAAEGWHDHARQAEVERKSSTVVGRAIKECLSRL